MLIRILRGVLGVGNHHQVGLAMFGKCVIKTWSSTQSVVALSSGEAEYYALVNRASHGIGLVGLWRICG